MTPPVPLSEEETTTPSVVEDGAPTPAADGVTAPIPSPPPPPPLPPPSSAAAARFAFAFSTKVASPATPFGGLEVAPVTAMESLTVDDWTPTPPPVAEKGGVDVATGGAISEEDDALPNEVGEAV